MGKSLIIIFSLVVMAACSYFTVEFPEIEGWSPSSKIRTYDSTDLWKLIDGAAEQFLAYGFQVLRSCDLASDSTVVTIDIYDMSTPLNAFGIYTAEKPEGRRSLPIGTEAAVSPPYQCLLLKDRFYVKINAYRGEITEASGKALLSSIAKALPGEADLPRELDLLPVENMVPLSHGFVREGYLGLSELENCVHARYVDEKDGEYELFIMLPAPDESVESMWERMAMKWKPMTGTKYPVLISNIPCKGPVAVTFTEKGALGLVGPKDEPGLLSRLQHIKETASF